MDALKNLPEPLLKALSRPGVLEAISSRFAQNTLKDHLTERTTSGTGAVHPFYSFTPRPGLKYQSLVFKSTARMIALIAGNQTGKTLTGKRLVVARMLGSDPVMNPGVTYKTPCKVWAFTKGHLIEGLFKEVLGMIPPSEINGIRYTLGRQRVELKNGSELEMKSYDLDRDAVQQAKCDIVWWDEEGPKDFWVELWIRLAARDGMFLLTLTPVKGTTWLHEKLFKLDDRYRNAMSGRFAWFTASMLDNDTLSRDVVGQILEEVRDDPDARDIRIHGIYRVLSGSDVYTQDSLEWQRENCLSAEKMRVNFDHHGNPISDPETARNHWKVWEEPVPAAGYSLGADISEGGEKGDYSAAVIVKNRDNSVVASWHGHELPDIFGWECMFAGRWYNNAIISPEMNKQGGAFMAILRECNYPAIYQRTVWSGRMAHFLGSFGWHTNQFSKSQAVLEVRRLLNERRIRIHDGAILEELANFQRDRKEKPRSYGYSAAIGHDDRVMALAIAIQASKQGVIGSGGGFEIRMDTDQRTLQERWRDRLEEPYENPAPIIHYNPL